MWQPGNPLKLNRRALSSFVSSLSGITLLHWLLSSILKIVVSYILCGGGVFCGEWGRVSVLQGERVNPVLVTASWTTSWSFNF